MNQKGKTLAMVVLCAFCISIFGISTLKETENENIEVVEDVDVVLNTCTYSGVSGALCNILKEIELPEKPVVKNNDSIMVGNPYYNEGNIEPKITFKENPVDKLVYVYTDLLNMRSEASTSSEVLTLLHYGEQLQVIGETAVYINDILVDNWTHVIYDEKTGYVNSKYIIDKQPYVNLGIYDITYYCPCALCCDVETGITASGAIVQEGVTIAADPSIPFGTELIINGHTYIVQDRGGAIKGNHIDIFCNSHEEALQHARHYSEVLMKIDVD